jgi:NAD+ kinase
VETGADPARPVDLAIALGGDGTVLRALRRCANAPIPVFGVNFGEIGFLATVDRDEAHAGFERALDGAFETMMLPAIEVDHDGTVDGPAINDVAITRRPGERVAELAYLVGGEEVGRVRCDGLVVASPAGSTGYNLANGGPVMAWGVEGLAVSFIAPHSLTARALVVAPGDPLTVHNRSHVAVDVAIDGRPAGEIEPGGTVTAAFRHDVALLAQLPGSSFYRRLREKFGRLASS